MIMYNLITDIMKRLFLFLIFIIAVCSTTFAQRLWDEETQDKAYEAPKSMFIKKWYTNHYRDTLDLNNETYLHLKTDGTCEYVHSYFEQDVNLRYSVKVKGSWTRNKDMLTLKLNFGLGKLTINQSDLSKFSLRKQDLIKSYANKILAQLKQNGIVTEQYKVLRLDADYLILGKYANGYYNDFSPDCYVSLELVKAKMEASKAEAQARDEGRLEEIVAKVAGDRSHHAYNGQLLDLYDYLVDKYNRISKEVAAGKESAEYLDRTKQTLKRCVEELEKVKGYMSSSEMELYMEINKKSEYYKILENERKAVSLYCDKQYEEALQYAEAQLEKEPSSFVMKRVRFLSAAGLERWEDAEKFAQLFFSAGSEDKLFIPHDYTTYGKVLRKLGKTQEAINAYEQAVKINPEKTETIKECSSAYNSFGIEATDPVNQAMYFKKAAEYYQMFIDKGDYSTNDLFRLAGCYLNVLATAQTPEEKEDAYAKAIKTIDEVISRVPDDYRITQRKARICAIKEGSEMKGGLAVGPYETMMKILETADVDKDKKDKAYMEAYMYLASYYLANDDSATAISYYEKYLELDPTNDAIRETISKMK